MFFATLRVMWMIQCAFFDNEFVVLADDDANADADADANGVDHSRRFNSLISWFDDFAKVQRVILIRLAGNESNDGGSVMLDMLLRTGKAFLWADVGSQGLGRYTKD